MGQESPKELVKANEKVELEKMAKDVQEEINGTKEPISNVIKKAQNSMSMNLMTILSHWEKNKQQARRAPASWGRMSS